MALMLDRYFWAGQSYYGWDGLGDGLGYSLINISRLMATNRVLGGGFSTVLDTRFEARYRSILKGAKGHVEYRERKRESEDVLNTHFYQKTNTLTHAYTHTHSSVN